MDCSAPDERVPNRGVIFTLKAVTLKLREQVRPIPFWILFYKGMDKTSIIQLYLETTCPLHTQAINNISSPCSPLLVVEANLASREQCFLHYRGEFASHLEWEIP